MDVADVLDVSADLILPEADPPPPPDEQVQSKEEHSVVPSLCVPDAKTEVVPVISVEEREPYLPSGTRADSTTEVAGIAPLRGDSMMPSSGPSVKRSAPSATDLILVDAGTPSNRGSADRREIRRKACVTSSFFRASRTAPPDPSE